MRDLPQRGLEFKFVAQQEGAEINGMLVSAFSSWLGAFCCACVFGVKDCYYYLILYIM